MPEQPKLQAVLDTNVFVSGLMGVVSPPRQIVNAWLDGDFILVTSLYLIDELNHVLSYPRIVDRLRVSDAEVEAILAALLSQAEMVPGKLKLPGVTRDPKDDPVVACAVEGKADYIVSGDQDLLVLEIFQGVQIITPRQFVELISNL
ncbi:MAG: putative toxin-antitoxin system toxin component, PIN family [Chloroflexota bacterium]|nr:putative toxin-antitoxin system toxin component, PIN family [Chloroflexota bacterium]